MIFRIFSPPVVSHHKHSRIVNKMTEFSPPGMGIFFPLVPLKKPDPGHNKEFFSDFPSASPFFFNLAWFISIFHAISAGSPPRFRADLSPIPPYP
ncbi:MAG: hypothetical protein ACYC0O_08480 [Desulfurivibrionaceae bacterium]